MYVYSIYFYIQYICNIYVNMSIHDLTWKPKQIVGTTLNIDAHELIL